MYKGIEPETDDYLMGRKVDKYIEKKSESTKDGNVITLLFWRQVLIN